MADLYGKCRVRSIISHPFISSDFLIITFGIYCLRVAFPWLTERCNLAGQKVHFKNNVKPENIKRQNISKIT